MVQPPIHLSDLYGELAKAGSELAPQGLCSIATIARRNGYDVTILDAQALKLSVDETIRRILELQPDIVGFTLYTTFIPVVSHISTKLKELYKEIGKNVIILVGGSHATITREKVLEEHPPFDIACIGEGEETFC